MRPLAMHSAVGPILRLLLAVGVLALSACQYLQPRSVDEIEKGRLPAPIERVDTRDGVIIDDTTSAASSMMADEERRLAKQRERAQADAVLVLSAGATRASGLQAGSALTLQFKSVASGEIRNISIELGCEPPFCAERLLRLQTFEVVSRGSLAVDTLPEGRWRLHSARLKEVSALVAGEQSDVTFSNPPQFEMRNGHATYLGAFTVVGGVQRIVRGSGAQIVRLPMVRDSNVEPDMERALTEFPETRGRRVLDGAQGLKKPQAIN